MFFGLICALAPSPGFGHGGHGEDEFRAWHIADGREPVVASFLTVANERAVLRSESGKILRVPLEQFGDADRAWLQRQRDFARRLNDAAASPAVPSPATTSPAGETAAPPGGPTSAEWFYAGALIGVSLAVAGMARTLGGRRVTARPVLASVGLLALSGIAVAAAPEVKPAVPATEQAFSGFRNKVHSDANYVYVESDGLPDHPMMKGIRSWQQQVPLPQPYAGANAWRIPLKPVLADKPVSARDALFRGAIALAVNGVPIFNAKNNRGEDALLAGELDEWGGHCGRADDYHYHAAPLHLQKVVGNDKPIAYALDGLPIYGLTNPDGSAVGKLDEFNGKFGTDGTYRYHATKEYPYINGGLRGVVQVKNDGVEPQPRAAPVRPALPPLRGAKITELKPIDKNRFELDYEVGGRKGSVTYAANADGTFPFKFTDVDGTEREETYRRRAGAGPGQGVRPRRADDRPPAGGDRPASEGNADRERDRDRPPQPPADGRRGDGAPGDRRPADPELKAAAADVSRPVKGFVLRSPAVAADGALPKEFTGDGEGVSPPLAWDGVPAGTKSLALIMHHVPPGGGAKWYWTLYDVPADVSRLGKDARDVGKLGTNSVNDRTGYAPPHSKGPGRKTYVLTLYALSSPVDLKSAAGRVDRNALLTAMSDRVVGTATLEVNYDRTGMTDDAGDRRGPGGAKDRPPSPTDRTPPPGGNPPRGPGAADKSPSTRPTSGESRRPERLPGD